MEMEVDGIISREFTGGCDCDEECGFHIRSHQPRALFELIPDVDYNHTPEELESGYCDHYDQSYHSITKMAFPSNGARWTLDIMGDQEGNNEKYRRLLIEFRQKQLRGR